MRTILLTAACLVTLLASYSISQDQIKISINKNAQGDMMFYVSGHAAPVLLEVNGKAVTIDVDKSEVNMEQMFAFSAYSAMDTAAGAESPQGNAPAVVPPLTQVVPPITSSSNPSQATPTGSNLTPGR